MVQLYAMVQQTVPTPCANIYDKCKSLANGARQTVPYNMTEVGNRCVAEVPGKRCVADGSGKRCRHIGARSSSGERGARSLSAGLDAERG